jgi:16S rRNA (uracil1498-N3)-methyltransferase
VSITLAPAVLKGESLDEVVRDATTLGVVKVRPVIAARSEVTRTPRINAARVERWRRIAVAAAKQCGRAVVPAIEPPESFTACVGRHRAGSDHITIMTVEPEAADAGRSLAVLSLTDYQRRGAKRPETATILIGPEGGWTGDELTQAAAAECELVTLGRRTFRADATPLVALALFQFLWGDL